jgi:hypothetical protein
VQLEGRPKGVRADIFFEKVSELAGVKLGKKFSAPQSLV